jgi:AraC-like DNA-binding protein
MPGPKDQNQHNILFSCTFLQKRSIEQFVEDHALGYVLAGEMNFFTNEGVTVIKKGMMGLIRKNQLVKSIKVPPAGGGEFRAINILLDQQSLRQYSSAHKITMPGSYHGDKMLDLTGDVFIKSYFDSLLPYFDQPEQLTETLAKLKTDEAITLLLRHNPDLGNLLFDFNEPHKLDLEEFMNRNFTYHVPLLKFARLTGRSLATFKRDFQKIFVQSPEKWLLQKRLEEAHYLITQKQQNPGSVYLDVGFENLSHFSVSFKNHFGYNASSLLR